MLTNSRLLIGIFLDSIIISVTVITINWFRVADTESTWLKEPRFYEIHLRDTNLLRKITIRPAPVIARVDYTHRVTAISNRHSVIAYVNIYVTANDMQSFVTSAR